jgi:hypothetical protein
MTKAKKIILSRETWEMIRIKTKTKKALAFLKVKLDMLTFDEVVWYAILELNKNLNK